LPLLQFQGEHVSLRTDQPATYTGAVQGSWQQLTAFFNEQLNPYSVTHLVWRRLQPEVAELQFTILKEGNTGEGGYRVTLPDNTSIFDTFRNTKSTTPVCNSPFPTPVRVTSVWPEMGKTTVQTSNGLQNLYINDFIVGTDWQLLGLTIDYIYFYSDDIACDPVSISANQVANVR